MIPLDDWSRAIDFLGKTIMNQPISTFDHVLDGSIVQNSAALIVTFVYLVDDGFVAREQTFIEQVEYLHSFQRHLHDYFQFEPKVGNKLGLTI